MKPKLFSYPNKMIIVTPGVPGPSSDAWYQGPRVNSYSVDKSIAPTVAPYLYIKVTDHSYWDTCTITVNVENGGVPAQEIYEVPYWSGGIHSTREIRDHDECVDFTSTITGLEGQEPDILIQPQDSEHNPIEIPGEIGADVSNYYPCFFQEITDKQDLLDYGYAGIAVENLYYCRLGFEIEPTQNFQIEGYTKEVGGETVNIDFEVSSLVRKIRIPGSSKVVAYDFFAKETNI